MNATIMYLKVEGESKELAGAVAQFLNVAFGNSVLTDHAAEAQAPALPSPRDGKTDLIAGEGPATTSSDAPVPTRASSELSKPRKPAAARNKTEKRFTCSERPNETFTLAQAAKLSGVSEVSVKVGTAASSVARGRAIGGFHWRRVEGLPKASAASGAKRFSMDDIG